MERAGTALLVVDVQKAIFQQSQPVHEGDRFLANVVGLIHRARAASVPVIFVQHCGPAGHPFEKGKDGWALHPALDLRKGEPVFEKSKSDSFSATGLEDCLRDKKIGRLIICGYASPFCVDTTVRSASGRGYGIVLAHDAHTAAANPILSANQTVEFVNFVMSRFAEIKASQDITF